MVTKAKSAILTATDFIRQIEDMRGRLTALIAYLKFLKEAEDNELVIYLGEKEARDYMRFAGKLGIYIGFCEIAHRLITYEGLTLLAGCKGDTRELEQAHLREIWTDLHKIKSTRWFYMIDFPAGSYEPEPLVLPDNVEEALAIHRAWKAGEIQSPALETIEYTLSNGMKIKRARAALKVVDPWD